MKHEAIKENTRRSTFVSDYGKILPQEFVNLRGLKQMTGFVELTQKSFEG